MRMNIPPSVLLAFGAAAAAGGLREIANRAGSRNVSRTEAQKFWNRLTPQQRMSVWAQLQGGNG